MAMPLKALPAPLPVPEQEAMISCMAPVKPNIDKSWVKFHEGDRREVHLTYLSRGDAECIMNPPSCNNCTIYSIAQNLKSGKVILSKEEFDINNLDAFKPELK